MRCASQLPASIWFPLLHNFLRLCCFNIRTSRAPLCLSATSCMHLFSIPRLPLPWTTCSPQLVSISTFPPNLPLIKLPKLSAFTRFQYLYYTHQEVQRPSPSNTSGVPPPSHFALLFLLFLLFTPLPAFHLRRGSTLVVNLGESALLEDIHLASVSKIPPASLRLSAIPCIHSLGLKTFSLASWPLFACIFN